MDGETVSENFEKSGKGNDGDTGISKARQLVEDISLAYQGSYVLIDVYKRQSSACFQKDASSPAKANPDLNG